MRLRMGLICWVAGVGVIGGTTPLHAGISAQLVQSVPEGTGLETPGIERAQDAWVKLFAHARQSIDMGQFYLANAPGSALEPVIQEIEKAGARGVKIRVIIDPGMIKNDLETYERFKRIPGLEIRTYDIRKLTGGIIHAKYFIVDGERTYVGSHNFDWRALTQIHEIGAILQDAEVAAKLTRVFEVDWEICKTGQAPKAMQPPQSPSPNLSEAELVASPPELNPSGVRYSLTALKELLRGARRSIRAQVMDYNTSGPGGGWNEIDTELRAAAARGVRVEFMISDWSLSRPATEQIKALARTPGVTIKIVAIPQPQTGCIPYSRTMHSKMVVVDGDTLWVGTNNWSQRYFTNTRGVELLLRQSNLARQGDRLYDRLWTSRYASVIDLDKQYSQPKKDCGQGG